MFLLTAYRSTTLSISASVPRRWNGSKRLRIVSAKLLYQLGCRLFLNPCASSCTSCPSALRSTSRCRSSSSSSFTRSKLFNRTVPSLARCGLHRNQSDSFHNFRSEEHTSELQSRGHLVCRL